MKISARLSTKSPAESTYASALIAFALYTAFVVFVSTQSLANFFHDDSFFYVIIARNLAGGLGYSFDGINPTNGFHPLWLWLLTGVASTVSLEGDFGIRVTTALYGALSIASALVYTRLLDRYSPSKYNILFLAAYTLMCATADTGQESALFGFVFSLIVRNFLLQLTSPHPARLGYLLLLSALLIFARQDSVFILGAVALASLLDRKFHCFLSISAGTLVGLLSLAYFNYINFGHPYSISSWLKVEFDVDNTIQVYALGLFVRCAVVLVLLIGSIGMLFADRDHPASNRWLLNLIFCTLLAYVAYFSVLFTSVASLGSWYFNQPVGFSLFLFVFSLSRIHLPKTALAASYSLLIAVFLLGSYLLGRKVLFDTFPMSAREMGVWLNSHTQKSDVIFLTDGSGRVAYFANRSTINGDGLVNSMSYQREIRGGRICEYLHSKRVSYIATNTQRIENGLVIENIPLWRHKQQLPFLAARPQEALYTTATPSSPVFRLFPMSDTIVHCGAMPIYSDLPSR